MGGIFLRSNTKPRTMKQAARLARGGLIILPDPQ